MQTSTCTGGRLVLDLPTRWFHWALAVSFVGACLLAEEDGSRSLHVMFGYTVAGLLVFRLLWGFVGSPHARFRDFADGPRAAATYLRDLVQGRARDCEGHHPAGSWAICALLALAAATVLTGWLNYNELGGKAFEEVHPVLANAWLVMVPVHVAGSGPASGRASAATGPRQALGSAEAVLGFWTWTETTGGGSLLAGAEGTAGEGEHAAGARLNEDEDDD